jgi:excisionase family DNA binding protein
MPARGSQSQFKLTEATEARRRLERAPRAPLEALLTVKEVAELLRIHQVTVYRMVRRRDLPSVRVGRELRFDPADLRRWIEAHKE